MPEILETLVAVDIGNSRIKLGRFDRIGACAMATSALALPVAGTALPEPTDTLELALKDRTGRFDTTTLSDWCEEYVGRRSQWITASVHRGAARQFIGTIEEQAKLGDRDWPLRQLSYRDIPLAIDVDESSRVGIDRLLAAAAANRIRSRDRAAILVDSGSATTVDLVSVEGAFRGGAILPGIAMAARALHEQTDALPLVATVDNDEPPVALGKSTVAAIESGLFWGAVGAMRELIRQISTDLEGAPDVFFTGGASPRIAKLLGESEGWGLRHVPHLVLAGIAIIDRAK